MSRWTWGLFLSAGGDSLSAEADEHTPFDDVDMERRPDERSGGVDGGTAWSSSVRDIVDGTLVSVNGCVDRRRLKNDVQQNTGSAFHFHRWGSRPGWVYCRALVRLHVALLLKLLVCVCVLSRRCPTDGELWV
jgi:hypothetical protein